jgi:hypothetical protein
MQDLLLKLIPRAWLIWRTCPLGHLEGPLQYIQNFIHSSNFWSLVLKPESIVNRIGVKGHVILIFLPKSNQLLREKLGECIHNTEPIARQTNKVCLVIGEYHQISETSKNLWEPCFKQYHHRLDVSDLRM